MPNSRHKKGPSWSWYCSWIYNYMCNQCLSSLKLWVRIPFMARCARYNICLSVICDKSVVFSGTPVSSINKTDRHNITELLLKVALNTINQPNQSFSLSHCIFSRSLIYGFWLSLWYLQNFFKAKSTYLLIKPNTAIKYRWRSILVVHKNVSEC